MVTSLAAFGSQQLALFGFEMKLIRGSKLKLRNARIVFTGNIEVYHEKAPLRDNTGYALR
jgi:hypothetical protein